MPPAYWHKLPVWSLSEDYSPVLVRAHLTDVWYFFPKLLSDLKMKFTRPAQCIVVRSTPSTSAAQGPWFMGHGHTHCLSSHAMAVSHIQNRGRLAQVLAQGQSSQAKRGRLATDVSSGPIFLTKKWKNKDEVYCPSYSGVTMSFMDCLHCLQEYFKVTKLTRLSLLLMLILIHSTIPVSLPWFSHSRWSSPAYATHLIITSRFPFPPLL